MAKEQGARILIVDDEKGIRSFLRVSLTSHGYAVSEAATGSDALEKSVSAHPDVIVLDLGLPDIDGLDVITEIRRRAKTPIIILSVREDVSDKVAALEAGADDYLTKPFSITELEARLKAVMRRLVPQNMGEFLEAGDVAMDIARHRVTIHGIEVDLTPTEFEILKLLMLNTGKVVTHKQILQEIWNKADDIEGVLHLLRVTISNLRGKIEPRPDWPTHILTEPGIGYRLRADDAKP
jgi:two-component system, OmpR family, KDP operon response regulator KdpE